MAAWELLSLLLLLCASGSAAWIPSKSPFALTSSSEALPSLSDPWSSQAPLALDHEPCTVKASWTALYHRRLAVNVTSGPSRELPSPDPGKRSITLVVVLSVLGGLWGALLLLCAVCCGPSICRCLRRTAKDVKKQPTLPITALPQPSAPAGAQMAMPGLANQTGAPIVQTRASLLPFAAATEPAQSDPVLQPEAGPPLITPSRQQLRAARQGGSFAHLASLPVPLPLPPLPEITPSWYYAPSSATAADFAQLGDKVVLLDPASAAFVDYAALFAGQISGPPATITAIHEILSLPHRLDSFQATCQDLKKRRGDANLQLLWHGTSLKGALGIAQQGFAVGGAAHGSAYGVGVYFGAKAGTSLHYAHPDAKGEQHMVLAAVGLGRLQKSRTDMFTSTDFAQYDSGTNDVASPRLFVVWTNCLDSVLRLCVISFIKAKTGLA